MNPSTKESPQPNLASLQAEIKTLQNHLEIAKRELQKLERMKPLASSAAAVVHDVRNSLGVIQSTAQFVLKKLKPAEQERKAWEMVERNAESIKKILKGYLGLARQGSGEKEKISLNELVENVVHFIELEARKKNVAIESSFEPSAPSLLLERSAMESAVLNLAINSIEAMEGGRLKFTTKLSEQKISLEIEDTGPGIPKEVRDKLFEPFMTTKENGTGMGLFSVKEIVKQNGGEITAQSGDGGTKMILSFPLK